MDKDRGYAWVILGASTILMSIGPSTFTSIGFLLNDVTITRRSQEWILNVFYTFWVFAAFIAALFAKQRPRQLATTGAAIACIGLISSASSVKDPIWLYLTFSIAVGFGLGLSFHTAYLVVMSNFDRHKGLANGVCQLCIALGQIITPLLFTVVDTPRDRFQIKSLTTALGFLTTLFFVVPNSPPQHRRSTLVGDRNRRYSTVSRRSSQGEAAVPLHGGYIPNASNSIPINQIRTRRRSQYLLQVSTSLLPNIPEEPESAHNSTNGTLTSASSESEVSNMGSHSASVMSQFQGNGIKQDINVTGLIKLEAKKSETESNENIGQNNRGNNSVSSLTVNNHTPLRRLSEGCLSLPAGVSPLIETTSNSRENGNSKPIVSQANGIQRKPVAQRFRRFSESQLESSKKANQSQSDIQGSFPLSSSKSHQNLQSTGELNNSKPLQEKVQESNIKSRVGKGESIIDFSLLRDIQFFNMAIFSTLSIMTIVDYPVLLYAYIVSSCKGDCMAKANVALSIIYLVDLISRLPFSYLSDFGILSKRTGFLLGSGVAGIIIAATPFTEDIAAIYFICMIYGLCMGMLTTCQHLMFIETFGFAKFPLIYGFVYVIKLFVVCIIGAVAANPISVYLYSVHPFDQIADRRNRTSLIDPFEIFQEEETSSSDPVSMGRLLVGVAIPSMLCALAWVTEDIYKASQRCSTITTANKTQNSPSTNNDVP